MARIYNPLKCVLLALFILIGFNGIEIASGQSEERINVKSELKQSKQEFKNLLRAKKGLISPEIRAQVKKLDKKSLKAFENGQYAEALRCFEKAIAILSQVPGQKPRGKYSLNNKHLDEHEQPVIVNMRVGSKSVEVLEAVPLFETGKDVSSYASGFKSYRLNSENGNIILRVGSTPLIVKEITDQKSSEEGRNVRSDNKDSPFGLSSIENGLDTGWVRHCAMEGLVWDFVEPERGKYNWSILDKRLTRARKKGVRSVVTAVCCASWDQGMKKNDPRRRGIVLPKDMNAYQTFLKKAVNRYPFVDAWQIENEVDWPRFWADTPENYVKLLRASYRTIKKENPDALVVFGGASSEPLTNREEFWSRFFLSLKKLSRDGERVFDVFDAHYFVSFDDLNVRIQEIRKRLDESGYQDIPIWMIEVACYSGQPNRMPHVTEKQQASEMVKIYVQALNLGVSKLFWQSVIDSYGYDGELNGYFDNTGLITNPRSRESYKKLVYYSYKKLIETLKGCDLGKIETLKLRDNVLAYRFLKNEQPIYIIWNNSTPLSEKFRRGRKNFR
jgi:hypothetical protein